MPATKPGIDLTPTQLAVLKFMVRENDCGGSATLRGICEHFGWSSVNAATGHVRALASKGYVVIPGGARGHRITKKAMRLYSKRRPA